MKKLLMLMLVFVFCLSVTGGVLADGEVVEWLRSYHLGVERFPQGENVNTTSIAETMKEQSGLNIKQIVLPKNDPRQKMILTLASGDVPDLMSFFDKNDFYKFANQGLFMPVDDYLNEMDNYQEKVSERLIKAPVVNGQTVGFVCEQPYFITTDIYVRTDILKELGLDIPETVEEYYQVLKTIKEEKDIIPLSVQAGNTTPVLGVDAIAGAWGCANPTMDKDGKLVFTYIQPEYKEFLTYMKKLYDEGLLDEEFALNKSGQCRDKFAAGEIAMSQLAWWDAKVIDESMAKTNPDAEMEFIKPPVGPGGEYGVAARNPIFGFLAIPVQAKNPEGAIKLVDYLFSDDRIKLINNGVEGIHYNEVNGEIVHTDAFTQDFQVNNWAAVYNDVVDTKEAFFFRLEAKGFVPYYDDIKEHDVVTQEATHLAPPIPEYDENLNTLQEFVYENAVKFVMGARPLSEFDDYVKEFNSRGGTEAIEAMNEWYTNK